MVNQKSRIGRAILRLWTPRVEPQRAVHVGYDGTVQLSPGINFSLPPAGSGLRGSSLPDSGSGRSGQSSVVKDSLTAGQPS